MNDNQTITLPRSELAGYQRAIESAKDRIALLVRERDEARKATAEFDRMRLLACQEVERLAPVAQENAVLLARLIFLRAERDGVEERLQRAEAELSLLREWADDLARWREAGGDIRDLTYVFETMDRYQAMKGGSE